MNIGQELFHIVPTPIRLKTTIDKTIAQKFYLKNNMTISAVVEGKKTKFKFKKYFTTDRKSSILATLKQKHSRKKEMQGNSEAREKFKQKKQDPSKKKYHKEDREWRDRRRNRHDS